MERTFAFFPITGAVIELDSAQQVKQYAHVGYERVMSWSQAIGDQFVTLIALALPEHPARRMLAALDFDRVCRRAVGGEGVSDGQQQQRIA